jgi:hypothetical protein
MNKLRLSLVERLQLSGLLDVVIQPRYGPHRKRLFHYRVVSLPGKRVHKTVS